QERQEPAQPLKTAKPVHQPLSPAPQARRSNDRDPIAKTQEGKPAHRSESKPPRASRSSERGMGEHVPAFMTRSVRPLD
ncbi:MAG: hypothetical protein WBD84_12880, partial [Methyloceanibacter sp.]